jgi:hypothetical protein
MSDQVLDEIRKVRDDYAARFHHDPKALLNDLKKKERRSKRRIVSFEAKRKANAAKPR